MSLRKTNSNATIPRLKPEVRVDLDRWLLDHNLSYAEVSLRLKERHNVRVSKTSLCNYYPRAMQERILQRVSQSRIITDGVEKQLKDFAGDIHSPLINLISEQAFQLVLQRAGDTKDIKNLCDILLKVRQQEIDFRKLQIAEAAAKRAAKADDIAANGKMTEEQKTAALKKLFGIAAHG